VSDCGRDCGTCADCLERLPLDLVELMATSRKSVPAVYATAVKCAGMWLRAFPEGRATRRRLNRAG
jgi:hypothetical protein